ncbi:MAG: hypothetical protein PUC23_00905 [bacterium]|nr:hypothetical protein [bacterium]
MDKNDRSFDKKELKIADKVADELLIRRKEHILIWLFLLILVLLCSFFPALVFSRIGYHSLPVDNYIQEGKVLFSFEEGSRNIEIVDATPTSDLVGKSMTKDNEYFKFRVAITSKSKKKTKITYEISLTPNITTLDPKYVRIYLVEDGKEILINGKSVNNFSELSDSTIREGSKLLYKNTVTGKINKTYTFKMWLSDKYELKDIEETFSCFVNVDAY